MAKLDKDGLLHIERQGRLKRQGCPISPESTYCGDWCPLFLEHYYKERLCKIELACSQGRIGMSNITYPIQQDERL